MRDSLTVAGLKSVTELLVWFSRKLSSVRPCICVGTNVPTMSMPLVDVSKSLVKNRNCAMLAALVMPSATSWSTWSGCSLKFCENQIRSLTSTRK